MLGSSKPIRLLHGLVLLPSRISGKMTKTLDLTTIFALLDARSFAMPMLRCLPLSFKPPKFPCQTSNPPCPSKPLIGYVTALLSPSYSVVSCRWRLKFVPCWNMEMLFLVGTCLLVLANRWLAMLPLCSAPLIALLVAGEDWSLFLVGTWRCCSLLEHVYLLGYHNISYLINASIYLVKGGRLGLMPGVLFHSCCPSFPHIDVMFPDFAFLTRLGDNGNPLTVRLGYHNISYLINASIYLVKGGRLGLMPGVLFHSCCPSFPHIDVMFPDFAFLTRLGDNGNPLTVRLE